VGKKNYFGMVSAEILTCKGHWMPGEGGSRGGSSLGASNAGFLVI